MFRKNIITRLIKVAILAMIIGEFIWLMTQGICPVP